MRNPATVALAREFPMSPKTHILVVEDETDIANLIKHSLERGSDPRSRRWSTSAILRRIAQPTKPARSPRSWLGVVGPLIEDGYRPLSAAGSSSRR